MARNRNLGTIKHPSCIGRPGMLHFTARTMLHERRYYRRELAAWRAKHRVHQRYGAIIPFAYGDARRGPR